MSLLNIDHSTEYSIKYSTFEEQKNIIQTISDHNTFLISLSVLSFFIISIFFHKISAIRHFPLFASNSQIVYAKLNNVDFEIHNLLPSSKFIRLDLEIVDSIYRNLSGSSKICLYNKQYLIQTLTVPFSFDNSDHCNLLYLKQVNFDTLIVNSSVQKMPSLKKHQQFQFSVSTLNSFLNPSLTKFYFLCIIFSTFSLVGFILLHDLEYDLEQKITIALAFSCIIKNILLYFNINIYAEFISYLIFTTIYIYLLLVITKTNSYSLFITILLFNCSSLILSEFIVYKTKKFLISTSQIITALLLLISIFLLVTCFIYSLSLKYQHKKAFCYFFILLYALSFIFNGFIRNIPLDTNLNLIALCIYIVIPFIDNFSTFLFLSIQISLPTTYIQL